MGNFGDSGDFNAKWNANGCRKSARMCSIRNLVMHLNKVVYIPWYLVVGGAGLGAGPHGFKKLTFFYVPEPKYTDFQQKKTIYGFRKYFFHFCVKRSYRIWVLCYLRTWIFISYGFFCIFKQFRVFSVSVDTKIAQIAQS